MRHGVMFPRLVRGRPRRIPNASAITGSVHAEALDLAVASHGPPLALVPPRPVRCLVGPGSERSIPCQCVVSNFVQPLGSISVAPEPDERSPPTERRVVPTSEGGHDEAPALAGASRIQAVRMIRNTGTPIPKAREDHRAAEDGHRGGDRALHLAVEQEGRFPPAPFR